MHSKLLSAVSAAALTLAAISAVPVLAQEEQLEQSVATGLAELGYDSAIVGGLSDDQLMQIQNVLAVPETDRAEKTAQIDVIVEGGGPPVTGRWGVAQLRDSVAADLGKLGMSPKAADSLSLEELAQVENVMGGSETDDVKRGRIERILAAAAPAEDSPTAGFAAFGGDEGLEEVVRSELARIGIVDVDVESLTVGQLGQIKNALATTEDASEQRIRVEQILEP